MKRITSVLLCAILTIFLAGFVNIGSVSAATDNKVKLLHAEYQNFSFDSDSPFSFRGSIEVEKIEGSKEVNVVSRTSPTAPWVKIPTTYAAPTGGNFEAWEWNIVPTKIPGYGDGVLDYYQFYIEYLVDGQRYIDDNNGKFYIVGEETGPDCCTPTGISRAILNEPAVKMADYCLCKNTSSHLGGAITLKNIALHKDVKVVYTTDNWATVKVATAHFSQFLKNTNNTLERWYFNLPDVQNDVLGGTYWKGKVEMAVMYTVDGVTYWDTNYNNRNYVVVSE